MSDITGYVAGGSPQKRSRKSQATYLMADIQTSREQNQRLVTVDAREQTQLSQLAKRKSPVKLRRVELVPSIRDNSQCDIKMNRDSSVEVITSKSIGFQYNPELPVTSENIDLHQWHKNTEICLREFTSQIQGKN